MGSVEVMVGRVHSMHKLPGIIAEASALGVVVVMEVWPLRLELHCMYEFLGQPASHLLSSSFQSRHNVSRPPANVQLYTPVVV